MKGNSILGKMPVILTDKKPSAALNFLWQAGFFVTGFLFSFSGRNYAYSPLGAAFAASCPEKYLISSALGASTGYIFSQNSIGTLRYIAAVLCAFVLAKLMYSLDSIKYPALFAGLSAAFCIFATGVALSLADLKSIDTLILYAVEAAAAFTFAYFFHKAFEAFFSKMNFRHIGLGEFSLYSLAIASAVFSLSDFTVFSFSLARAAGIYLLLLSATAFKEYGCAIFGSILSAIFTVLSRGESAPLYYCFSGLACCAVSSYGNAACSVCVLAVCAVFFFLETPGEPVFMIEAAVAAIAFSLTPKKFTDRISAYIACEAEQPDNASLKRGLAAKIKIASGAVSDVGKTVSLVSGSLCKLNAPSADEVYTAVSQQVCAQCASFDKCWEKNKAKTVCCFDEIAALLRRNELVTVRNLPRSMQSVCIKQTSLAECFNKSYLNFAAAKSAYGKLNDMRLVVADQFGSVCDILSDISDSLKEDAVFDAEKQAKIRKILFSYDISAGEIVCKIEKNSRMTVEIECDGSAKEVSRTDLTEKISSVCGRDFELPAVSENGNGILMVFCEKNTLKVSTGFFQVTSKGESLCGDSAEYFFDGRGKYSVVLSDGMGTGSRAAVDGAMTSNLISKLIKSGFSPVCSLKIVNSALIVKSREESMSSLDIMQVDMFSGKTDFYKAGAAQSFIKKKNRVYEIAKPALPLGILREVEFASVSGSVGAGDIAVLVSDGAAESGSDFIRREVLRLEEKEPEEIAKSIVNAVLEKKGDKHDDLTAVVCKFS